jgi:hypothetical protein
MNRKAMQGFPWKSSGLSAKVNLVVFSKFGSLAQLVEQRTFNPLVAGSNPARPTKQRKGSSVMVTPFPLVLEAQVSRNSIFNALFQP